MGDWCWVLVDPFFTLHFSLFFFLQYKDTTFPVLVFRFMQFVPDNAVCCSKKLFINLRTINFFITFALV